MLLTIRLLLFLFFASLDNSVSFLSPRRWKLSCTRGDSYLCLDWNEIFATTTPGNHHDETKTIITDNTSKSRRTWIASTFVTAVTVLQTSSASVALDTTVDQLPPELRDYTKLAPLGPKNGRSGSPIQKSMGISPEEMVRRLTNDLVRGANGRGGYFISGDLSLDLFRDDCVFEDPTNRVDSLSQYQKALTVLFDPNRSFVDLLDNGLTIVKPEDGNDKSTKIVGRLRSRGYLGVLPWEPYVTAYETTIIYTLDPFTGLVARQDQTWSKAASKALKETFTPSFNGSPPKSTRAQQSTEPSIVTFLFDMVNGRRPYEYSLEEMVTIDAVLDEIASMADRDSSATTKDLEGTWILAYLQPGPNGSKIDRRIPFFPELDTNDNFQIFSRVTPTSTIDNDRFVVTNIGQVLGSWIDVRVSGSLREIHSVRPNGDSISMHQERRRFEAKINGGKLCIGAPLNEQETRKDFLRNPCPIDLPMIQGTGIFDSVYIGDRIRIGQNINGGGARVVQVRL